MKQWYETLFENYGQKYDSESFTQGTIGECRSDVCSSDLLLKKAGFDTINRISMDHSYDRFIVGEGKYPRSMFVCRKHT